MTQLLVPVTQAESPTGSGDAPFPAGQWNGTIDEVRTKGFASDHPSWPWAGYASDDGEVVSLQIGNNTPVDAETSVGERKFFVDLVIRDGELTLDNVDLNARDYEAWQLQRGARLMANLATALGATEIVDTPDGQAYAIAENFVDELSSGEFNGIEVGFKVRHRKGNNGKVYAEIETFTPAV